MGRIIIPTDNKYDAPWFLSSQVLEELHYVLIEIEKKLEVGCNNLLYLAIKEDQARYLKNLETYPEDVKENIKSKELPEDPYNLKNSYKYVRADKYVILSTKQGKKIEDKDLLSLIKDSQLSEFSPTRLSLGIVKGPCEFILEINGLFSNDGSLSTKLTGVEDDILSDIYYELSKWIEKHKPNFILNKWSKDLWVIVFPLFIGLLVYLSLSWVTDYNNELARQSLSLLNDGLSDKEVTKAIELLLKTEIGYIPETFYPDYYSVSTLINFFIFTFVLICILFIKPKTVIGLGKNKWKIKFYSSWTYIVLSFIPLSILLPIFRAKLFK
ncbi:MAG: hypothetical protein U0264_15655 [Candidatus Kapaibacterium sp.]